MNLLLDTTDLICTGRHVDSYWPATPTVQVVEGVAVIDLYGCFDRPSCDALEKLCGTLLVNDSIRGVLLAIDSWASRGSVAKAVIAVRDLAAARHVEAIIDNAEGAALLVALAANKVWARALAPVGNLGAYSPLPEWEDVRLDPGLTQLAGTLRPWVPQATWRALLSGTINGEQAEAAGIVDGLANVCDVELAADIAKQ
jgi:hypothetical protein